ncbi:MAG: prepilin-type N-terminal cleavage/methylation domain-containing protein [Tepidisphaeraceae bacterium]
MLNAERGMLNECRTKVAPAPSVQHSSFIIQRSFRGFTLTEILFVIALIVLIIALAVPAFRAITGSRSVDAGENLVSAMLGRARGEAMLNNRVAGVAFFRDENTDRTAMALVVQASQRGSLTPEPAGLEHYKGWKEKEEDGIAATQYTEGDVVIALVDMPAPDAPKKGTKLFVCIQAHSSTNATKPPNPTYWGSLNDAELDTLSGYEYQLLPPGVGAQTINDPDPANSGTLRDRYLRSGLILFDGSGALMHRKYLIRYPLPADTDATHLFRLMGFDNRTLAPGLNNTSVGLLPPFPIYSQIGVVLYDQEIWKNQGGTEDDPLNDNVGYTANPAYNEMTEEQWLDSNTLNLMINRYNGTLIRGE